MKPILIPLFEELRGERVAVMPFKEEDAQSLHEAIEESREHLRPWMSFWNGHQTVDESREWINEQRAEWILRRSMKCGVFDVASGRYVGEVRLVPRNWDIPSFEIGYWLRTSAEGKGYISEAVRLVTDFALDKLGAKRVEILCQDDNERSANVARRLGYVYEGLLRNDYMDPDGNVTSTLVFSLTPDDRRLTTEH